MTGGLMQLVAYGAQDVYLTGNPMVTFFKSVFRRHTNFATESIKQFFNGIADFERGVSCVISRNGDLISGIYLEATLPSISGIESSGVAERWTENVGHHLVRDVEVEIGGQIIDKHYGDWLEIWAQLTVPAEHKIGYYEMIGQDPMGPFGVPGQMQRDEYSSVRIEQRTIFLPLQFWFCRNIGLALPLIALQFHEVTVHFTFAKKIDMMRTTNETIVINEGLSNVFLWVDYVYLDDDERRKFTQVAHEYLIEQLQTTGDVEVTAGTIRTNPKSVDVSLDFNHPVKELVWVVQNQHTTSAIDRQPSNYTSVRANRPQRTNEPTIGTSHPLYGVQFTSNPPANIETVTGGGTYAPIALSDINTADELLAFTDHSCINPPGALNPVNTAQLILNGHERFAVMNGTYFNWYQCYRHHTNIPASPGINVYSFALKPEEHQPSGSCNFSRIDNAKLTLTLSVFNDSTDTKNHPGIISGLSQKFNTAKCNVRVYAINYNILRVMSGMGGLAYVN
jgi:hypothetical protein